VPALSKEDAEAVKRALFALSPPLIEAVKVVENKGWRRNLVLSFTCKDAATLRPPFAGINLEKKKEQRRNLAHMHKHVSINIYT
jgi:hypothetical protein